MSREVMKMALAVLKGCLEHPDAQDSIIAIEHELAQPAQEPAFYGFMLEEECCVNICYSPCGPGGPNNELPTAYYTSPPQRQPLKEKNT